MNYSNMLLGELIKEAYHDNNGLALEIIKKLEDEMDKTGEFEPEDVIWGKAYDEGWNDALDEAVHRLERM